MAEKIIKEEVEWDKVLKELEEEKIKLAFYDNIVISLLGKIENKKILDYGGGPGVLASALQKLGSDVKEYDISEDMLHQAAEKIGKENIYFKVEEIPDDYFDIIICNLVLCIVSEDQVKRIVKNIKNKLSDKGFAYIGFCNPKIYDITETNIDFRPTPKHKYQEIHSYMKTKKEGGYQIIENHRPIEWYEKIYKESGLDIEKIKFTPKYTLKKKEIEDFIIFKLKKGD
jgi:2-polyprenyl-3-methyl-5-hydroxy-6-metoxy-1,4-benzoquinol methylase